MRRSLSAASVCAIWLLAAQGCSTSKAKTTPINMGSTDIPNDAYANALIELGVTWPTTVSEADEMLERWGYKHTGGTGAAGTARDYALSDSGGEITLLVNVDRRFAAATYRPSGNVEVTGELIKALEEKCASSSFSPPDEFGFHFRESMTDSLDWVTDVGIAMPRGTWRYTTTRFARKEARP